MKRKLTSTTTSHGKKNRTIQSFFSPGGAVSHSANNVHSFPKWGSLSDAKICANVHRYQVLSSSPYDAAHALAHRAKRRPLAYCSIKYQPVFVSSDRVCGCGSLRSEHGGGAGDSSSPSFDPLRVSAFGIAFFPPFRSVAVGNMDCILRWSVTAANFDAAHELLMTWQSLTTKQRLLFSLVYYSKTIFIPLSRLVQRSRINEEQNDENLKKEIAHMIVEMVVNANDLRAIPCVFCTLLVLVQVAVVS